MTILSSGATDIGQKRKTNQDSICLHPDKKLYVVADGMGGHNGGDIASQMSVKLFPQFVQDNAKGLSCAHLLDQSIKHINQSIFDHAQNNEELKGMGTTIVSLSYDNDHIYFGNVGDSRAYMLHGEKLFQMTRDHSLVQEKLKMGIYDRDGARRDPQKNILTRTVGFEKGIAVDVFKYKACKHDLFMLCSDGLHGKVSDPDILHILQREIPEVKEATQEQLNTAVKELIALANSNGGQDNISVIIVLVK